MLARAELKNRIEVPENLSADSVNEFERGLKQLLSTGPQAIEFDCSNLKMVTSSHVNLLWSAREQCCLAGVSFQFTRMSAGLVRILHVLDLYSLFTGREAEVQKPGKQTGRLKVGGGPTEFTRSLKADTDNIAATVREFRSFLDKTAIDELSIVELTTIAYEALTNVRLHGELDPHQMIEFKVTSGAEKICMVIEDSGKPFNPLGDNRPYRSGEAIRSRQSRGYGLVMIRRMTDALTYERADGRNILALEKHWN
ncbi:MAG: ATP-binding protein [Candidatus Zixiibacteriota bacterium]